MRLTDFGVVEWISETAMDIRDSPEMVSSDRMVGVSEIDLFTKLLNVFYPKFE